MYTFVCLPFLGITVSGYQNNWTASRRVWIKLTPTCEKRKKTWAAWRNLRHLRAAVCQVRTVWDICTLCLFLGCVLCLMGVYLLTKQTGSRVFHCDRQSNITHVERWRSWRFVCTTPRLGAGDDARCGGRWVDSNMTSKRWVLVIANTMETMLLTHRCISLAKRHGSHDRTTTEQQHDEPILSAVKCMCMNTFGVAVTELRPCIFQNRTTVQRSVETCGRIESDTQCN